jgi:hypothetical protein
MVEAGYFYPVFFCLVTASFLALCSAYAFSGAGMVPQLPFLKPALLLCGSVFVIRGVVFVPLMALKPELLAPICNSKGVDTFLVLTSLLCLFTGAGLLAGGMNAQTPAMLAAPAR